MPTDVIMPALGLAQETGRLIRWFYAEGDTVIAGEPMMEVETDKATVAIESPASGILAHVGAAPGDDIAVGRVIAVILGEGEGSEAAIRQVVEPESSSSPGTDSHADELPGTVSQPRGELPLGPSSARATPRARRLAAELGVDLMAITGTARGGAVTESDVLMVVGSASKSPRDLSRLGALDAQKLELGTTWSQMAKHVTQSWQSVPQFAVSREVDASAVLDRRRRARSELGYSVTVTDVLIEATAQALSRHPRLNASWIESNVVLNSEVNVGIAVSIQDGVVVPIIHQADRLSIGEIAGRRTELMDRARGHTLVASDLEGGTFTLSNLGMFGIDDFVAIVNAPQAAILAVGAIAARVVAKDASPQVRPTIRLSLTADHRVVDGALAAQFMAELGEILTGYGSNGEVDRKPRAGGR